MSSATRSVTHFIKKASPLTPDSKLTAFAQYIGFISAVLLTLLLNGCSTPPQKEVIVEQPAPSDKGEPLTAERLVQIAMRSASPHREELLLEASQQALREQSPEQAKRILTHITYNQIDFPTKSRYIGQLVRVALFELDPDTALRIFDDPRYALPSFYDHLAPLHKASLGQLRAQAFELQGRPIEAIMERIHLGASLGQAGAIPPSVRQPDQAHPVLANNNAIWNNLMSLPPNTLSQLGTSLSQQSNPNQVLVGWLALANIHTTYSENLAARLNEVSRWQSAWPRHPGSLYLPSNLAALMEASKHQPNKLALIIPQSGKFKRAASILMHGFMSAYYHAQSQHIKTPEILLFDSEQGNILDIYQAAVDQGADMVIGPLSKDRVDQLHRLDSLPVPTLTLNYATQANETPANLFQFGLAAEDEVEQIADRAYLESHQYAAILYPDTEWGVRVSTAFKQHWKSLSGTVAAEGRYSGKGDYSSLIKETFLVNQSIERARTLKGLLGGKVEFTPRRRQDIDFIVILAGPMEARQIVPTLAFHYIQKVPLFSTSNIYSGRPNPASDKDLNNVTFVDLPWVLGDEDPIKLYLRQQIPSSPRTLSRLQAMGADAYRLHQQLAIITLGQGAQMKGSTGHLYVGANQRIKRRSSWATFKAGQAIPDNTAPVINPVLEPIDKPSDLSEALERGASAHPLIEPLLGHLQDQGF